MLNSKPENELVKDFVDFLVKQGYPSKQIYQEPRIISKTAKVYGHLDIAVIVGDKIIEAFEFKTNAKSKHHISDTLRQLSLYQEHVDSSVLSNDIRLTTYDDGEWWIFSRQNETWLLAKDILSFKNASEEFVNKVKPILSGANVENLVCRCQIISLLGFIYVILYVATHLAYSIGCCKCLLPLNWELLALLVCVAIIWLFPYLLRIIKKLKISNVELEFVELEAHRLLKQNE